MYFRRKPFAAKLTNNCSVDRYLTRKPRTADGLESETFNIISARHDRDFNVCFQLLILLFFGRRDDRAINVRDTGRAFLPRACPRFVSKRSAVNVARENYLLIANSTVRLGRPRRINSVLQILR